MDLHTQILLEQYDELLPVLEQLCGVIKKQLEMILQANDIEVTTVKARVKKRDSLEGKLHLKGSKYLDATDITDLVGARIITYYTDDVDRIAALAERYFEIDWENSVDKRKMHDTDSFGYNSLHYICRMPKSLFSDPQYPQLNELRFELQLRTTLQHAWASMNHDIDYKSGVPIPKEYVRQINRLAGMLELADDAFSRIRVEINDYRRRVHQLVQNGQPDEIKLDAGTFSCYLQAKPFERLNQRIAALNQAEIQDVPLDEYLQVLISLGCETLGDVDRLRQRYEEDAYTLARFQLSSTDLDIISSAIGIQNICIVCILAQGGGKNGLTSLFNEINGDNPQNSMLAEMTYNQALNLSFMNK
ncbi:MAG: (p)ppGpp synthetase [Bacteroidales bacterium]|jgi:ppGpp synthetase/RelA/SpoT-type nucleotidyltranferase|nr:(p)ppGpp synthetase [Bacteroidales bacterium]